MARRSVQELLNIKSLQENAIVTFDNYIYAYFKIKESNLSIMSKLNVMDKVTALSEILSLYSNLYFDCLDSKEDLENNKIYYRTRIDNEKDPLIRKCLEKELDYLNDLEIKQVTRKTFLATLKFDASISAKDLKVEIDRFQRLLDSKGLASELLSEDNLKSILAMYLEKNTTTNHYEDVDGERWMINV